MKLLLDTNALIWWLDGRGLGNSALEAIAAPHNHVAVSVASLWEIAIKESKGKLRVDADLKATLESAAVDIRDIDVRSALAVRDLPYHHGDPFDRMIIAQAMLGNYTVITRDKIFPKYGVETLVA